MHHAQPPRKQASMSQNEADAKQKLANYVYEYLHANGHQKAAEMFKSEIPGMDVQLATNGGPGFLYNWWTVFWDLYSATPDRRDKADPTQEAKVFVDYYYNQPGPNGMPPFPHGPGPMGMPPGSMDPAMMSNFYRQAHPNSSAQASPVAGFQPQFPGHMMNRYAFRPGAPMPPVGFPPNAAFDPRMMAAARMPAQRGIPFPPNMRPQMRPGMYGPQYLESPTTPTFSNPSMVPNGAPMNGPGPSMMNGPPLDPNNPHDPRYQMMAGMNPQFPMMNDPCGAGTPTSSSAGPTSIGGVGSVPPNIGAPSSVGSTHGNMSATAPPDASGMNNGQLSSLLSGGNDGNPELKQSPASVHQGINGGTPQHHGPGSHGPSSVTGMHGGPGSVHSQIGAPSSVNAGSQPVHSAPQSYAQHTPQSNNDAALLDYQGGGGGVDASDSMEIQKIKQSLIDDFPPNGLYNNS